MKKSNIFLNVFCVFFFGLGSFAMAVTPTIKLNNNLGIEPDGTMVATGAGTMWADLSIFPDATGKGTSSPLLTPITFAGSTLYNLWDFTDATSKEVFFVVQLPHSYREGSDLLPHVHWMTYSGIADNTNKVQWRLDYSIATIGTVFPATTTLTGNQLVAGITTFAANEHLITSLGTIVGTNLKISDILICRLSRDATSGNAADTFVGDAGLLSMDFHYEMDTNGSRDQFAK